MTKRVWSPQQEAIFAYFKSGTGNLCVRARAGCLTGDTQIAINRNGRGWTLSLVELAAKQNGLVHRVPRRGSKDGTISRMWDRSLPTFVQREDNGVVRLARLKEAWASGQKQTYELTTASKRTIRATAEHPFLTEHGFSILDDLKVGMQVQVRGTQRQGGASPKKYYPTIAGLWRHPYAAHHRPSHTHNHGVVRVPLHRLVAEAVLNNLQLNDFLNRVYTGDLKGLTFINPATHTVHHEDRDPTNNATTNLVVLTNVEHRLLHAREGTDRNVAFKVVTEKITKIKKCGMEETYDLEVADDPHNFLANGFVVHNTGKTTTILEGVNRAPEQNILLCAFNKRIADELTNRLDNVNAEARTLHSVGFGLVRKHWKVQVDEERGRNLAREAWAELRGGTADNAPDAPVSWISRLASIAKSTGEIPSASHLVDIAYNHDVVPEGEWQRDLTVEDLAELAVDAMARAAEKDGTIDYDDMIWLPNIHKWGKPMYDLIVVDECFPAGTLVQTVHGPRRIETVMVGDIVQNAIGSGVVTKTFHQRTTRLVKVWLHGHDPITCTPNHPFLTQQGWVKSCDLTPQDIILNGVLSQEIVHGDMRAVPESLLSQDQAAFLQSVLHVNVGTGPTRTAGESGGRDLALVSADSSRPDMAAAECDPDGPTQSNGSSGSQTSDGRHPAPDWSSTAGSRWERPSPNQSRAEAQASTSRSNIGVFDSYQDAEKGWIPDVLQGGCSRACLADRDRGGWVQSRATCSAETGSEENQVPRTYRVDRVEVLEPADHGLAWDGTSVYNLAVSGHPSYVVGDVVVHNCQDLSTGQLDLALSVSSGRIAVVGDEKQAIYSWRGADSNSLDRLKKELKAEELPLTITYRCPRKVVEQAQALCPDFFAAESAPEGEVLSQDEETMLQEIAPNDFLLSRLNAPLASLWLKLIKLGKPARVEGRDLAKGLIAFIRSPRAQSIEDLLTRLRQTVGREIQTLLLKKRKSTESRIMFLRDRLEMVETMSEGLVRVEELITRVEQMFGLKGESRACVILSTVHKAKGLEARRVYILLETMFCRGKRVNQEEKNILYVAQTRAKETLVLVGSLAPQKVSKE